MIDLTTSHYFYLATPYTKYKGGLDAAFQEAAKATAKLIASGINVFSPIVHSHPLTVYGALDPLDLNIWLPANLPFMERAKGLMVCMLEGWEESVGIAHEIEYFSKAGKQIVYIKPQAT